MQARQRSRAARGMIFLIVVGCISVVLYALLGDTTGSESDLSVLEAVIIGTTTALFIRTLVFARRRVLRSPISAIDAAELQPGEIAETTNANSPCSRGQYPDRLSKIEGMVRITSSDPEYFDATFKPYVEAVALGATPADVPSSDVASPHRTVGAPIKSAFIDADLADGALETVKASRWIPDRWSAPRRRNHTRIFQFVKDALLNAEEVPQESEGENL